MALSNHSLGRWRSIKSVGGSVENEDGVAGVGLELVLCVDGEVGFSFGFCRQCFVMSVNDGPENFQPDGTHNPHRLSVRRGMSKNYVEANTFSRGIAQPSSPQWSATCPDDARTGLLSISGGSLTG